MHGFGCRLLGYDPVPNQQLIADTGISYVPLDELYKVSDVISLHCPLNEHTHYLLSSAAFAKMKEV